MANDKTFKVKNALEIGGSVKSSLGTVTSSNIDLSTGNYFKDSANIVTYTISNPSPVQSFNLELTGANSTVGSAFKTLLYTGNGAARDLTTNVDLATDGGLIWTKHRTSQLGSANNILVDTVRGANKYLISNTNAQEATGDSISAFSTTGYSMPSGNGPGGGTNYSSANYVSWTFKKTTKFFDIVTYTGNATNRAIDHNLGAVPGMMFIKSTTNSGDWIIYHRGMDASSPEDYYLRLHSTVARTDNATIFNDTAPTSTQFTVGTHGDINGNGQTYIAYLFGHDTSSTGSIYCGSYTGNGGSEGPEQNLGWQPQFVMIRNTDIGNEQTHVFDTERGLGTGSDKDLRWSQSNTEANFDIIDLTTNGFKPMSSDDKTNGSGHSYIFMAIRSASDPAITWPAAVKWPGGITPSAPAIGETDLYTFTTDDSGSSYYGYLSGDNLS